MTLVHFYVMLRDDLVLDLGGEPSTANGPPLWNEKMQ
jgi:hypothetical protein